MAGVTALALSAAACTSNGTTTVAAVTVEMADATLSDDTVDELTAAVTHGMEAAGATGAIVAVWVPWAGTWEAGIGSNQVGEDVAVTTDMHFRIGNVTRAMTCDLLYAAADDGDVALDDTVSDRVQTAPGLTDVTLQQLCDGTSGLGNSRDRLDASFNATPEREWSPRELAAGGISDRGRSGVEVSDSDAAYELLGIALQNATGSSARTLLSEQVFGPLGLTETELPTDAAATPGDPSLTGYISFSDDRKAGCVAPSDYTTSSASYGYTDAGVTSTIGDLAAYGQGLATRAVDDDGEFTERWASLLPLDEDDQYAGGTIVSGSLIGQEGKAPGYLTSVYADTETGMTVAVVLNNSAGTAELAGAVAKELAAIASKVPAADGYDQPEFGLPWTAEQQHAAVEAAAVCPVGD